MNSAEIPADAIMLKEYMREVASAEIETLEHEIKKHRDILSSAQISCAEHFAFLRPVTRAMDELHAKVCGPLLTGSRVAYGEPLGDFPIAKIIPAELWEHLVFLRNVPFTVPYGGGHYVWGENEVWCRSNLDVGFRDVRVAEAPLTPQERCRIWLRELVAAGGSKKPKFCRTADVDTAENSYFGEAKSEFGITKKGFEAAWAEVTRGHVNWTAPGRRRYNK